MSLKLIDLRIGLNGSLLMPALTLHVADGEIVTVMGPSGAGKSTLLAWVCGQLPRAFHAQGQVLLDGTDITHLAPEARNVAILYQDDLLFPHMSVGENLLFALPKGQSRKARRALADEALAEAGLQGFFQRDPATLSGGQRARVAVMRTLLSRPRALLLDEPFSKLDADTKDAFRAFVFDHARSQKLPTLLVTHDPADARAAEGRVYSIETPEPHEPHGAGHNNEVTP